MPNVKISDAADAGTLLSSDMLPLARSGDTNAYRATMAEISTFASTTVSSGAYNNVGRNLIHNPLFRNWQRGLGGFFTNGNYTADRWQLGFNLDTSVLVDQAIISDAFRAAIGDEAAEFSLQTNVVGNAGAASYTFVDQPIEDVRRLGGKIVTVSFWAWAAGTPRLGVSIDQRFGTGGSPSAAVLGNGQSVTLGAIAARYSLTFTIPSTSGKTLGTNGDDATALNFWFSSGTATAARAGGIGVQTANVGIWGVQLEIGATTTPLAKRDIGEEVLLCMRFYQGILSLLGAGYALAGNAVQIASFLPVPMRGTPTVTLIGNANTNVTSLGVGANTVTAYTTGATVVTTGNWGIAQNIGLSADL